MPAMRWPHTLSLAALAFAGSACQHPPDPPPRPVAASPAAARPAANDALDDGERRAAAAGAHSQACRRVREAVDLLPARGDINWLGIASNLWTSADDVAEYKAKTGTRIPLAFDADGSLLRAFGVHQIPTVVVLDRGGRVARVVGPDERDLAAAVREVTGAP